MLNAAGCGLPRGANPPSVESEARQPDARRCGRVRAAVAHKAGGLHLRPGIVHHRNRQELPPGVYVVMFASNAGTDMRMHRLFEMTILVCRHQYHILVVVDFHSFIGARKET